MVSLRFVTKRLLLLVPVLFGVATFVFGMLHLSPGDPAILMAGRRADQAFVEEIRRELGLNRPIYVQYVDFLWQVVRADFGESFILMRGRAVSDILEARFPVTLELALYGQFLGILFGVPLGVVSALKQDTLTDHLTRVGALAGISVPIFWSGPVLIMVLANWLRVVPTGGRIAYEYSPDTITGLITVDTFIQSFADAVTFQPLDLYFNFDPADFGMFIDAAHHMLLPCLVIGIYSMALISRMTRSSMLEVIRQDYMRTARAKGQGEKITILKHGLQNALIPVVTIVGIQFGTLLGGAILTETVFNFNGIGTLLVEAIAVSDYPIVQGTVLLFAFLFTLVNLGVDITYSYLDPRIDQ
ncbi:ABC transporter permease [Haloarchaeobius sp. DFWS5]|uniref:ABC transporter permease n=1 Tax=Haloarchaeobius sp. DFWS5 TaxID=3446114 RepID=UPI003EBD39DD